MRCELSSQCQFLQSGLRCFQRLGRTLPPTKRLLFTSSCNYCFFPGRIPYHVASSTFNLTSIPDHGKATFSSIVLWLTFVSANVSPNVSNWIAISPISASLAAILMRSPPAHHCCKCSATAWCSTLCAVFIHVNSSNADIFSGVCSLNLGLTLVCQIVCRSTSWMLAISSSRCAVLLPKSPVEARKPFIIHPWTAFVLGCVGGESFSIRIRPVLCRLHFRLCHFRVRGAAVRQLHNRR